MHTSQDVEKVEKALLQLTLGEKVVSFGLKGIKRKLKEIKRKLKGHPL